MNLPTFDQAIAGSRHVVTFGAGFLAAVGVGNIGGLTPDQIEMAFGHILNGIKEISLGVGPLAAVAMALWAAWKSSPKSQVQAAASVPGVTVQVSPTAAPPEVVAAAADPKQPKIEVSPGSNTSANSAKKP